MKTNLKKLMSAMDASTTQTAFFNTQIYKTISAQAIITGTAAGTLKWRASNDAPASNAAPTNWTDIPAISGVNVVSVAVAGAGTYLLPKLDVCYEFVQVSWVPSSGTGTITVNAKEIDA